MKILIISVNRVDIPHPVYPLGIDYVVGSIPSRHEVKVVDLNVADEDGAVTRAVADFKPDLVGLSIRNIDNTDITAVEGFICQAQRVVQEVRRAGSAKVVLGGSGFSILPEEIMTLLDADYGVIGEGERYPLLLDALENGREITAVPGLYIKGGPVVFPEPWNGASPRKISLDAPSLDYYLKNGGILNLQTKRGCPFKCSYCTYPQLEGTQIRRFDPWEVAKEALTLEKAGAKFLFMVDAVFNSDFDHNMAVAESLRRVGLGIPWGGFLAPLPGPTKDYFSVMARAGMTHVEFGADSLCPETLKAYRKPFKVEEVFEAHRRAKEAGLHIAYYLLLGGPGETKDTLTQTLDNAEKLDKMVAFFFEGVRIYPGTKLYEAAVETGQIVPGQNFVEPVYFRSPALEHREIDEMVSARSKGRMNWITGNGGKTTAALISMMHRQGHTGPLWEMRIR